MQHRLTSNLIILLISLIPNLILVFLPVYDTFNYSIWISLALSFHNSNPVFLNNLNPEGFLTLILFIPFQLIYNYWQNTYFVVIFSKLLLLIFTYLLALITIRILGAYHVKKQFITVSLLIILISPSILFINYIWAEIDIIPAFFITFAFYFLRLRPLSSHALNITFGVLSFAFSIFFFLYSLILLPLIIIYTTSKKDRIVILLSLVLVTMVLATLQIFTIQGEFYNYLSSFSGNSSNLAPGGIPTGLFYYLGSSIGDKLRPIIIILGLDSIVLPLILKTYGFSEYQTGYVQLLILLFTIPVINLDNFAFLMPFPLLSIITLQRQEIHLGHLIGLNLIMAIPILFSPLMYSYNNVFGISYWFYPLLHKSLYIISANEMINFIVPLYNLIFLSLTIVSLLILLLLVKNKELKHRIIVPLNAIRFHTNKITNRRIIVIVVSVCILSIPLSVSYNTMNNATHIENSNTFPIFYFYPESAPNSSMELPIGNNSFNMNPTNSLLSNENNTVVLERNLNSQDFKIKLNETINSFENHGPNLFAYSNSWSIGNYAIFQQNMSLIPVHSKLSLPDTYKNLSIPFYSNSIHSIETNGTLNVHYNLTYNDLNNKSALFFFKGSKISSIQSIPIWIDYNNQIFEIALYTNYAVIAHFSESKGWSQSIKIPLQALPYKGWNYVQLFIKGGELFVSLDNYFKHYEITTTHKNFNILVGNPLSNKSYSFQGIMSQMYSFNGIKIPWNNYFYFGEHGSIFRITNNSNTIAINFINSPHNSTLVINGHSYQVTPAKIIYFGKQFQGEKLTISVNYLSITYTSSNKFYLVPAFISFYIPLAFVFSYFIIEAVYRTKNSVRVP